MRHIGAFGLLILVPVPVLVLALVLVLTCPAPAGNDLPPPTTQAFGADEERSPSDPWRAGAPANRATNRGVAYMERYQYAEAVVAFERAIELGAAGADARVNLAIALFNRAGREDLERSTALLDEVLKSAPEDVRALYFRGAIAQYSGEDAAAKALFDRVVRLDPHDAYAWYLLARCKAHLGEPARAELERAVEENPNLVSVYYDLMRLAAQAGDQEDVAKFRDKFTTLRDSPLAETFVMPQYGQMGPLARVMPVEAAGARPPGQAQLKPGRARRVRIERRSSRPAGGAETADAKPVEMRPGGMAIADVNKDGRPDLAIPVPGKDGAGLALLLGQADRGYVDGTERAGLTGVDGVTACAFGDYDNDGNVDLFVSRTGANRLFRGDGEGVFVDVTGATGTAGGENVSHSAAFLDADHDGDLDLYVCNGAGMDGGDPAPNQLLNNNSDGTFTDIAGGSGVACAGRMSRMMTHADIDGDRDTDLVVFRDKGPPDVFINDRLGRFHPGPRLSQAIDAAGGVLQDFNGDGRPDLLMFSTEGDVQLQAGQGAGAFRVVQSFEDANAAMATWGRVHQWRVADVDLDGDLDVAAFGSAGHVLLNDGEGKFFAKTGLWSDVSAEAREIELVDLDGDGTADLVQVEFGDEIAITVTPTELDPPASWVAIQPTGDRGVDKRTRSPISGYGTRIELRCGVHRQVATFTGLCGGRGQSLAPVVLGLNGADRADFVAITWPDGVTQYEHELAPRQYHRVQEMERRVSSCPVLFAWDGRHFDFVGDFAGVGGLGYFLAPGAYSNPQVEEHVRIAPGRLVPRDGAYELRVCEPMEEVAYIDRLELRVIDHPVGTEVYPDERLAGGGPAPTHDLLCIGERVFAEWAWDPDGEECAGRLCEVDRVYAYDPPRDSRFLGFCRPHALVLEFGDRLSGMEHAPRLFMFITGSIEYPYSQTTFAAGQAGVSWRPLRIERQAGGGEWEAIVADAGAPGGMGRTFTVDLTGKLSSADRRLRLSTNLEISIDQVFIAADRGTEEVRMHRAEMLGAELRRLGFPAERSPDGRHPTLYTYDVIEPGSSFRMPGGAYTRYGDVRELLAEFDDRHAVIGTGDEIALRFSAASMPDAAAGMPRTFILVSHAYCKDMDLYTATGDTVEPLPYRGMGAYPCSPAAPETRTDSSDSWMERYNTRVVPLPVR